MKIIDERVSDMQDESKKRHRSKRKELPFARLFELPTTQLLITIEYNAEDDAYQMRMEIEHKGCRASIAVGFQEKESAIKAMQEMTPETAMKNCRIIQGLL